MRVFSLIIISALILGGAAPASARVDVVTSNQDLAWVVQAVGGNQVSVEYLAGSNQDPHRVEPRFSQVSKLARADMVVRVGMDLDSWMDALIQASGNGKIQRGGRGYVDASRGIHPLEVPTGKLDPSKGDIHVFGNPHYFFGPSNLRIVARSVADGLKRAESGQSATFESNYNNLVARLNDALRGWKAKMAPHRGKQVVTYHTSLDYLLAEFGLREAGNVEPRPGLSPTVGHVSALARRMKSEGVRVVLTEGFRPRRYADLLAGQAGAKVVVIPAGIGAERGINDYFQLIGACVDRLAAAL